MDSYWTVPREWAGETCFILAGGPSLRGFDARCLTGKRVIAINNSFLLKPDADVLYYADRSWWQAHRTEALAIFRGKYRVSTSSAEDGTLRLRSSGRLGLERDPSALRSGGNSGYQAIGLAFHFGVSRIVLLGYDMHTDGQQTHWHAGHPGWTPAEQQRVLGQMFLPKFASLVEPLKAAGVEVLNATPGSALKYWPYVPLNEIK